MISNVKLRGAPLLVRPSRMTGWASYGAHHFLDKVSARVALHDAPTSEHGPHELRQWFELIFAVRPVTTSLEHLCQIAQEIEDLVVCNLYCSQSVVEFSA